MARSQRRNEQLTKQSGFTLIEVMVAVMVIAIGLLGLAGLRAVSVFNTHASYLHSIAAIHSENIAEMMRANINAVDSNDYTDTNIGYATLAAPAFNCRSTFPGTDTLCSPANQARWDAFNWLQAIGRDMPSGTGVVTCNDSDATDADPCTDGSAHTIRVSWVENDLERVQTNVTKSFTTVFIP